MKVTVTNRPNEGRVIATWIPDGEPAIHLIERWEPAPATRDYSFVWPTGKYLDGRGTLRVQFDRPSTAGVDVRVRLSNGNTTDIKHSSNDWADFLPGAWAVSRDPVVLAVGDGASGERNANAVAASVASSHPDLFLYLGDIYQQGTFTENLNNYGRNAMDGRPGTLWGRVAKVTQPTLGNHEAANVVAWQDYFHGRPLYTSFRFGNVLFFDLASDVESMKQGSDQYDYVDSVLTDPANPPPPCIVAFFHRPVLDRGRVIDKERPMWALLTDHGGDLVLNGHLHTMIAYRGLNDALQLPAPGEPRMVQLVNGAGGHARQPAFTDDPRVRWSRGSARGVIRIVLRGARDGGTPDHLQWAFRNLKGETLVKGTRPC